MASLPALPQTPIAPVLPAESIANVLVFQGAQEELLNREIAKARFVSLAVLQTSSSCNEISNSTENDDTLSSVLLSSATCEKLSKSRNLIPTSTVCTVCLRSISLTAAGVIRTHRSVNDRCPESGRPPKLSTTPA